MGLLRLEDVSDEVRLRAVAGRPAVGVGLLHLQGTSAVVVVVATCARDVAARNGIRGCAVGIRRGVEGLAFKQPLDVGGLHIGGGNYAVLGGEARQHVGDCIRKREVFRGVERADRAKARLERCGDACKDGI